MEGVMEESPQQVHWAYIVGGWAYPKRYRNLCNRLQRLGINVIAQARNQNDVQVPRRATVVLVVSDMVGHTAQEAAQGQAEKLGIPVLIISYSNWALTEDRLDKAGFVYRRRQEEPVQTHLTAKLGEALAAKGISLLPEKKEEIPIEKNEEPPVSTNVHIERSKKIRALVRAVLDENKERLKTFSNEELALIVSERMGERVAPSTCSNIRNEMGYDKPPKGYKRPGIRGRSAEMSLRPASAIRKPKEAAAATPPPVPTEGDASKEFREIILRLKEWQKKHNVVKCYAAFDQGKWSADWEQAVITRITYEDK